MTPLMLQDFLVEEMKRLFDESLLKNAKGEMVKLNIYPQYVPVITQSDKDDEFPYLRVCLTEPLNDPNDEEPNQCTIIFFTGICDKSPDKQGHRDVYNILYRIYDHLKRGRFFDNRYEVESPFQIRLEPNDYWPRFFGELETNWIIGKITQIDNDYV
jgi:hypothetical protein